MSPPAGKFLPSHPLSIGLLVSLVATALSALAPETWGAPLIGGWFLAATYVLCLRGGGAAAPFGLSLGGLLEAAPLSGRKLLREGAGALGWAALVMGVIIPAYWLGFRLWYRPIQAFDWARGLQLEGAFLLPSASFIDLTLGHLLVIALPEEAFFRGYLQTRLEQRWPPKWSLFGASLGLAVFVTSVVFALGHLASLPDPARLAVFFPSLLFGWLRNRTGGIGAAVLTHAACNVLVVVLLQGYRLA